MTFSSKEALYPQYKQDTKIIAQWLDQTSKAHKFVSHKGKQRQAKIKNQYKISIADFGLMANFLSLQRNVSVPSYIWTSLSRAIRYRSTYGNYLQLQRDTKTSRNEEEDRNHLFFIDVLKNVQKALNRLPKPAAPVVPMTQTTRMTTRFASLDVEQPETTKDDVEDSAPEPVQTEESPVLPKEDVLFQPWEEDFEEALFQWRLFNVDVQRIRKQIGELWALYRAGHLSLAGVSTAHNIAIQVVRKLEQDIRPVFEKNGGYTELATTNFLWRYLERAADADFAARIVSLQAKMRRDLGQIFMWPTTEALVDGFDIAEEEMILAWEVWASGSSSWERPGHYGSYNGAWGIFTPRDDRQAMTNLEKNNSDRAVASGVVLDAQILAVCLALSNHMRLDELTTAIEEIVPWRMEENLSKHIRKDSPPCNDNITLRAVFATQLLLDSVHVLGTSIERPGRELRDKTARIFKSTKSLREFYQGPGALASGTLPRPTMVERIEVLARFWQGEDLITRFRREQKPDASETPSEKVSNLLRHDAPFCGWWTHSLQTAYYSHSISVVNSLSLPLLCARLYFAFVQEGLVPKDSWPDMDAFTILHRDDLWVGTAPQSGQYYNNLMMTEGNSIVGLASNARVSLPRHRTERMKTVTARAPVSKTIFDTFGTPGADGMSEEDLERLLTHTKLRWYDGRAVRPCFHHGWDKAGNHKGDRNPTSPETDNPFLRLAQAVDAETLEQSFDYMTLNRVCWLVLRALLEKARPILDGVKVPPSALPSWGWTEGKKTRLIVPYIFFILFSPERTAQHKKASAVADILLNLTKGLGRLVHDSTGIDWAEELKCTCADIPS
jgi:hypothetical protein